MRSKVGRSNAVLPLVGGLKKLGVQLTLLQPVGQIMPTTLLLAHPDLKTQRHLCEGGFSDQVRFFFHYC